MKAVKSAVEKFMEVLIGGEMDKVHALCTKTYKVGNAVPALEDLFPKLPESAKVGTPKKSTDCVYDVPIEATISGKKKKISARVICETQPFQSSTKGDWGVNPISVLKGLYTKE